MRYQAFGDTGPVVVLLHGIPGDPSTWKEVAPRLAERHRVIVPELLGFGQAPRHERTGHAPEQAVALLSLLDALGIERADLVGHDFGGPVALALYRIAAARVRSVTLLASNALASTPVPGPLRLAGVPLLGRATFRVLFGRYGQTAMWIAATIDKRSYPLREFRQVLRSNATVRSTRELLLASMRDLPGLYAPLEDTLRSATVPVLVIWGDRDPIFPIRQGQATAAAARNGTFALLEDCGHFIPREKPAETTALLDDFLATSTILDFPVRDARL